MQEAERASAYVVERVRRVAGSRWSQGSAVPPFELRGGGDYARVVATRRLHRVDRVAARGLVAWANGERDVVLLTRVPRPAEVLAWQAEGRRCVSLLEDADVAVPAYGVPKDAPDAGLAFALHDLCHLEKFVEPADHAAQVGFFRALLAAERAPGWTELDRRFDDAWRVDVEHVASDMNGSAIFLFAALKMKLKMAARREHARLQGRPPPTGGPLDDGEARAYAERLGELLELLELKGTLRDDALAISTKHDAAEAAVRLESELARRGA